jgi:hypothetical protein
MKVNEARRAEGVSSAPDGDTVQQAVNMAPLGWVPSARGGAGDQGSNQTAVPGEAGNGDPNRNPADDPAPGDKGGGGRAGVRQFECRLQPESTRCGHTPSKACSGQNRICRRRKASAGLSGFQLQKFARFWRTGRISIVIKLLYRLTHDNRALTCVISLPPADRSRRKP